MRRILVACTEDEAVKTIRKCFEKIYSLDIVHTKEQCLSLAKNARNPHYEILFLDLDFIRKTGSSGRTDYVKALESYWEIFSTTSLIVMGPQVSIRDLVMAVKAGANNYLTYPLSVDEVLYVKEGLEEEKARQSELNYLRSCFWQKDLKDAVLTHSPVLSKVLDQLKSVAPTRSTVLLTGETGTGKSLLAKVIHRLSQRAEQPFIRVHCGAIPDNLVESELFGHERGAFTGAVKRKLGKFEIAKGGTIFLDEVSTLTPSTQVKLLQVLQERSFERVGGVQTIESDVRVVAATNQDLKELSEAGLFRRDLYYRLNVFPLDIPCLRDRLQDIPLLMQTFLARLNKAYGKGISRVEPSVIKTLMTYSWPGNIRELENLVERAYILENKSFLSLDSFPSELIALQGCQSADSSCMPSTLADVRKKGVELIEKQYLQDILTQNQGRISITAQVAGISTRQLNNLMSKHGLKKEDFKKKAFQL